MIRFYGTLELSRLLSIGKPRSLALTGCMPFNLFSPHLFLSTFFTPSSNSISINTVRQGDLPVVELKLGGEQALQSVLFLAAPCLLLNLLSAQPVFNSLAQPLFNTMILTPMLGFSLVFKGSLVVLRRIFDQEDGRFDLVNPVKNWTSDASVKSYSNSQVSWIPKEYRYTLVCPCQTEKYVR